MQQALTYLVCIPKAENPIRNMRNVTYIHIIWTSYTVSLNISSTLIRYERTHNLGSFLSDSFPPKKFDIYFAQFFNLPHFLILFSKCVRFNELDFSDSGEFHEK